MWGDGPGAVVSAVKGILHAQTVLLGPRPVRPGPTPGADAHISAYIHTCCSKKTRRKDDTVRRRFNVEKLEMIPNCAQASLLLQG